MAREPRPPAFDRDGEMRRRLDYLEQQVRELQARGVNSAQQYNTEDVDDPAPGEIVVNPVTEKAHFRIEDGVNPGKWVTWGGGELPWVATWDTIYGAEYPTSTSTRLFFTQAARSINSEGIFSINDYADPQTNTGTDDRFGNDDWHLPVLHQSGVYTFTVFFEFTDRSSEELLLNEITILPTDIPAPSGSGAGDETFHPHEDISGFGFFRGIRIGGAYNSLSGFSSFDSIFWSGSVTLPILLDSSNGSGIPDPPAEFTSWIGFNRPSAALNEQNWARAAQYIFYHGPLSYTGNFPYFP